MKYLPIIVFLTILGNNNCKAQTKNLSEFLPTGYTIFEKIYGDLNKDGIEDCVLIIKGTNKNNIIKDKYRGDLDRNRRGIIILLDKNDNYELAGKNYNCFISENEDGGNYYPPELVINIEKGNLDIYYSNGRYGYRKYVFRLKNSDFELIGFDSSYGVNWGNEGETSINFLTKNKLTKVNTNENKERGEEIFKETWTKIKIERLIKLSEIKDLDEIDVYD